MRLLLRYLLHRYSWRVDLTGILLLQFGRGVFFILVLGHARTAHLDRWMDG